ncbi:hypothetical protein O6P43_033402 [Quillaja saponaria]|uniref:Uncharacterized protein n=1 Tax=Quillaja saponaria TaxID=32244 RepID=A0AAD7KQN3_QUISA|nr:hypothetical protein O6P43_033402 [Quillaja saponaria]
MRVLSHRCNVRRKQGKIGTTLYSSHKDVEHKIEKASAEINLQLIILTIYARLPQQRAFANSGVQTKLAFLPQDFCKLQQILLAIFGYISFLKSCIVVKLIGGALHTSRVCVPIDDCCSSVSPPCHRFVDFEHDISEGTEILAKDWSPSHKSKLFY